MKPKLKNNFMALIVDSCYNCTWITWAIHQRQKGGELL
jgi:hypothetical protein